MAEQYLRARVADLLHLLQFAKIETPSAGDTAQVEVAMKEIERMLAVTPAAPEPPIRMCQTMRRPAAECGCPDCGSSLIDWPMPEPQEPVDANAMAAQLAPMITEWVDGGLSMGQDWRLGLTSVIARRIRRIQRAHQVPTEQLWAVHAQGPDELWAAESRDDAEQHAAALNALPGQTDTIKVNAVVIPSPWSEVDHWKTLAEQWRHEAEDRIASLQGLSKRVEKLEAARELLHSTDMAKTMDIVTIGEALGIPGEEQQGGIAEFIEEIERLRQFERICEGLSQDCIDGGYTVAEHRLHCKRVEDELDTLRAEHEQLRKDAERYRWLRDHEATCSWEEGNTEARNHPGSLDEAVDESIAMEAANA